jgi:hypothetical protein
VLCVSNAAADSDDANREEGHGWRWTTGLLCSSGRDAEHARVVQTTSRPWHEHGPLEEGVLYCKGAAEVGDAFKLGMPCALVSHQSITAMFSAVIRGVKPSLRQQVRPCIAAAASHTQAAAAAATTAAAEEPSESSAPSKLYEGEQAIKDKLSKHFQTSELLVQDVSGAPPSC